MAAAASAAKEDLALLLKVYTQVLPRWTFPYVPFAFGAVAQILAWMSGRYMVGIRLLPRVFYLWLIAFFEYSLVSPAMNASQEILGMSETVLIVLYQMITLLVFLVINKVLFKNRLAWNHYIAFALALGAVVFAELS